jgi:hypothetical protein
MRIVHRVQRQFTIASEFSWLRRASVDSRLFSPVEGR